MSESNQFDDVTIEKLQEIRRANEAIKSCTEILNENGANQGSVPAGPAVFIRIRPNQQAGLIFAIEACARKISDEMDSYFEDRGVCWMDEFSPDVNREAEAAQDLHSGEVTYAEFEKRVSK